MFRNSSCLFFLLGHFDRNTIFVQFSSVHQCSSLFVSWYFFCEWQHHSFSIVHSAIVICSCCVVFNLDVLDVIQLVSLKECFELPISTLFDEFELFLSPHIQCGWSDHADVNAKSSVKAWAVNAYDNGVVNRCPCWSDCTAVETSVVFFVLCYALEYSLCARLLHYVF